MDRAAQGRTDDGLEWPAEWGVADDRDGLTVVGAPLPRVVDVAAIGPLTLFVRFDDGVQGQVRFTETGLYGVFGLLRDPAFFAQVGIAYGAVSWPDEAVDLAPDNMHRHLRRDGEWVLS